MIAPFPILRERLLKPVLWLLWLYFGYLMALITLQYTSFGRDTAFLYIKQAEVQRPLYLPAFYVHVWTSMAVLVFGGLQLWGWLRRHYPAVHRLLGRGYVLLILGFSAPSGLYMAWYANGGWAAQLSFVLLAVAWFGSTLAAFLHIKKGNLLQHRAWMYRSYALTLSAVTLRFWKWVLVALFHPRPMDVYVLVAWLGWVLNVVVVEWWLRQTSAKTRLAPSVPA